MVPARSGSPAPRRAHTNATACAAARLRGARLPGPQAPGELNCSGAAGEPLGDPAGLLNACGAQAFPFARLVHYRDTMRAVLYDTQLSGGLASPHDAEYRPPRRYRAVGGPKKLLYSRCRSGSNLERQSRKPHQRPHSSRFPLQQIRVADAFDRGPVDVPQGTRIRCFADSSRARFHCFATARQAIAARVPVVVRSGCDTPTDHQSEHRSAGRRTSVRWSPGHGARRAENPIAVLQVIPRSSLVQLARRLPGPFTARRRSFS